MTQKQGELNDFFTTHDLKTWPEPFDAMATGVKTHEVRRNDRDFKIGDFLRLKRWDPVAEIYTGTEIVFRVTYCHDLGIYCHELEGFVSMSIERIKK